MMTINLIKKMVFFAIILGSMLSSISSMAQTNSSQCDEPIPQLGNGIISDCIRFDDDQSYLNSIINNQSYINVPAETSIDTQFYGNVVVPPLGEDFCMYLYEPNGGRFVVDGIAAGETKYVYIMPHVEHVESWDDWKSQYEPYSNSKTYIEGLGWCRITEDPYVPTHIFRPGDEAVRIFDMLGISSDTPVASVAVNVVAWGKAIVNTFRDTGIDALGGQYYITPDICNVSIPMSENLFSRLLNNQGGFDVCQGLPDVLVNQEGSPDDARLSAGSLDIDDAMYSRDLPDAYVYKIENDTDQDFFIELNNCPISCYIGVADLTDFAGGSRAVLPGMYGMSMKDIGGNWYITDTETGAEILWPSRSMEEGSYLLTARSFSLDGSTPTTGSVYELRYPYNDQDYKLSFDTQGILTGINLLQLPQDSTEALPRDNYIEISTLNPNIVISCDPDTPVWSSLQKSPIATPIESNVEILMKNLDSVGILDVQISASSEFPVYIRDIQTGEEVAITSGRVNIEAENSEIVVTMGMLADARGLYEENGLSIPKLIFDRAGKLVAIDAIDIASGYTYVTPHIFSNSSKVDIVLSSQDPTVNFNLTAQMVISAIEELGKNNDLGLSNLIAGLDRIVIMPASDLTSSDIAGVAYIHESKNELVLSEKLINSYNADDSDIWDEMYMLEPFILRYLRYNNIGRDPAVTPIEQVSGNNPIMAMLSEAIISENGVDCAEYDKMELWWKALISRRTYSQIENSFGVRGFVWDQGPEEGLASIYGDDADFTDKGPALGLLSPLMVGYAQRYFPHHMSIEYMAQFDIAEYSALCSTKDGIDEFLKIINPNDGEYDYLHSNGYDADYLIKFLMMADISDHYTMHSLEQNLLGDDRAISSDEEHRMFVELAGSVINVIDELLGSDVGNYLHDSDAGHSLLDFTNKYRHLVTLDSSVDQSLNVLTEFFTTWGPFTTASTQLADSSKTNISQGYTDDREGVGVVGLSEDGSTSIGVVDLELSVGINLSRPGDAGLTMIVEGNQIKSVTVHGRTTDFFPKGIELTYEFDYINDKMKVNFWNEKDKHNYTIVYSVEQWQDSIGIDLLNDVSVEQYLIEDQDGGKIHVVNGGAVTTFEINAPYEFDFVLQEVKDNLDTWDFSTEMLRAVTVSRAPLEFDSYNLALNEEDKVEFIVTPTFEDELFLRIPSSMSVDRSWVY